LRYRDLELMLADRGVAVDHMIIFRRPNAMRRRSGFSARR
jgi:transposase-like protein